MKESPYSVYVYRRPLRIAFLVSSSKTSEERLTELIEYNQSKWGGRYNAIIQTDGHNLHSESDWNLLDYLDPDVIRSFEPLEDDLIRELDLRFSPYSMEGPIPLDESYFRPEPSNEMISILPTLQNVKRAAWGVSPTLVLFDLESSKDQELKNFIIRNFGILAPAMDVNQALSQVKTLKFTIPDRVSFSEAIGNLTEFKSFTYPAQLCALPKYLGSFSHERNGNRLVIVVGDSFEDTLFYWNRIHLVPQWATSYVKQLWLPTSLASDKTLKEPLGRWFNRLADPGGSNAGEIYFVSLSKTTEELKTIISEFAPFIKVRHGESDHENLGLLGKNDQRWNFRKGDSHLYRGTSANEHFVLTEPDVEEGVRGGEHWMADVYIGFSHSVPDPEGNWWLLPKNNSLAAVMFQKKSRISACGIPAVLMRRGEPNLKLTLLSEPNLFYYLLAPIHSPHYGTDLRASLPSKPFRRIHTSDKGFYLSGILDLFGDLNSAFHVFESRFWRRLFDRLSRNTFSNQNKLEAVTNKLKKKITANPSYFLASPSGREWIANYIVQLSKELVGSGREIKYKNFLEGATKELEDFNSYDSKRNAKLDESELKASITDMIEANILQLGIKPSCQRCGFKDWYHLNEASQSLTCKGCGSSFPVRAEEPWSYRLNTLVQAACALHGLTPVILVLGQLTRFAKSFFTSPCLDVFDSEKGEPYTDLDIVCIIDGKLIIGEVKQTNGLYDQSVFTKMTEVARRVRPDLMVFSSMEPNPTRFIKQNIQTMQEELKSLHIKVEWYRLDDYIFSPRHFF